MQRKESRQEAQRQCDDSLGHGHPTHQDRRRSATPCSIRPRTF